MIDAKVPLLHPEEKEVKNAQLDDGLAFERCFYIWTIIWSFYGFRFMFDSDTGYFLPECEKSLLCPNSTFRQIFFSMHYFGVNTYMWMMPLANALCVVAIYGANFSCIKNSRRVYFTNLRFGILFFVGMPVLAVGVVRFATAIFKTSTQC